MTTDRFNVFKHNTFNNANVMFVFVFVYVKAIVTLCRYIIFFKSHKLLTVTSAFIVWNQNRRKLRKQKICNDSSPMFSRKYLDQIINEEKCQQQRNYYV